MWKHCVLVSIVFSQFVSGLEIMDPPPDQLWVKESESTEFCCKSDQPWQWCYWELTPIEDEVVQLEKTRRFQTHQVIFLFFVEIKRKCSISTELID